MANALYRAAVRELETVLPPRVVSQSLHEGLAAVGKTADTLGHDEAATIVRGRVLPRLTLSLGGAQAQAAVTGILERLAQVSAEPPAPALSLGTQARAIRLLQESLRPFNIYFEWSETQKLRAQLSLIETEHAAGRDASELIGAAQLQLGVLQQKLNDQLSVQARELIILAAALQASSALNSPKVRRLAQLLELIRSSQEAQQRAPAEVERAHKLAGELRAEKLQLLGEETRELLGLRENYSTLLALDAPLATRLSTFQKQVEAETLLGSALPALRAELESTQETLRQTLQSEFRGLLNTTSRPELTQLLTLSLKVLETTLPPATDVQQIRDRVRESETSPAQLGEFHRLETEAEPYRELPNELGRSLSAFLNLTRGALEQNRPLPELQDGWLLLEQAQAEQVRSAQSFLGRLEAAQAAAAPLLSLNSEEAISLRWWLQALGAQLEAVHRVSPKRQAELETGLKTTEALIMSLQDEATATRTVAAQLIEGRALDDVLGFFDTLTPAAPPTPTAKPAADRTSAPPGVTTFPHPQERPAEQQALRTPELQQWLARQAAHEGVAGLALFTESADTLLAGDLPTDAKTLQRAVRLTKRRADTLGLGLEQGAATSLTVETPEHTLVAFWLNRARSLVLITRAPTWGGSARQHLEDALPELVALLE